VQADPHPPARLLIADDHELAREGLRAMLDRDPHLEIVAEAASGREAVHLCQRWRPDVVLMDVRMPDMTGLQATQAIREVLPSMRVLMVTMHEDSDYLVEAIEAGAAGYVLKDATRAEIIGAIRRVLRSDGAPSVELSERLARQLARQRAAERAMPIQRLTPREHEVLQHLAAGYSNGKIADRLTIGRGTVKGYVEIIIRKLAVADRTEAAVKAVQLGLVRSRPDAA
jgi:NarL family two-component system response regulator LiaR